MRVFAPKPFVSGAFRQFDAKGDLTCVLVLKATLVHVQGQDAELTKDQGPLCDCDSYAEDGDPQMVPLVTSTDYAPAKLGTDVTFVGQSFAPDAQAKRTWPATLAVGPMQKQLTVSGPRQWEREKAGALQKLVGKAPDWRIGPATATDTVPIDWRLTQGGWAAPDTTGEFDARNPIGRSVAPPPHDTALNALPKLPQLSDEQGGPAGFGPLAPFYRDRQQFAGTYDDTWLSDRHPLLPEDFDPRFWNVAPPDQVITPHLGAGSPYRLSNLSPVHADAIGHLPPWQPVAVLSFEGETTAPEKFVMALNDVQFDWRDDHKITLVWRAQFALADAALAKIAVDPVGQAVAVGLEHTS